MARLICITYTHIKKYIYIVNIFYIYVCVCVQYIHMQIYIYLVLVF